MNASLISIRPRFADAIFGGSKGVELRRRRLHVTPRHLLFVYETSPVMAIRGLITVDGVDTGTVASIWRKYRGEAGVTAQEFRAYFAGNEMATAIRVGAYRVFEDQLTLSAIRERCPLFHPPRTWTAFARLPLPLQTALKQLATRDLGWAVSGHRRCLKEG